MSIGQQVIIAVGVFGVGLARVAHAVSVQVFAGDAAFENDRDRAVAEAVAVAVDAEGVGGAQLLDAIVEAVGVGVGDGRVRLEGLGRVGLGPVEVARVVAVFAGDADASDGGVAIAQAVVVGVGVVGVAARRRHRTLVIRAGFFVVLQAVVVGVGVFGVGEAGAQLVAVREPVAAGQVSVAGIRGGDDDVVDDAGAVAALDDGAQHLHNDAGGGGEKGDLPCAVVASGAHHGQPLIDGDDGGPCRRQHAQRHDGIGSRTLCQALQAQLVGHALDEAVHGLPHPVEVGVELGSVGRAGEQRAGLAPLGGAIGCAPTAGEGAVARGRHTRRIDEADALGLGRRRRQRHQGHEHHRAPAQRHQAQQQRERKQGCGRGLRAEAAFGHVVGRRGIFDDDAVAVVVEQVGDAVVIPVANAVVGAVEGAVAVAVEVAPCGGAIGVGISGTDGDGGRLLVGGEQPVVVVVGVVGIGAAVAVGVSGQAVFIFFAVVDAVAVAVGTGGVAAVGIFDVVVDAVVIGVEVDHDGVVVEEVGLAVIVAVV